MLITEVKVKTRLYRGEIMALAHGCRQQLGAYHTWGFQSVPELYAYRYLERAAPALEKLALACPTGVREKLVTLDFETALSIFCQVPRGQDLTRWAALSKLGARVMAHPLYEMLNRLD